MARQIDRKLRVTAALLGARTCKDLGAAFRRVNPATVFEVSRAHKWMQGRASPREASLYEDWALVVDIGRPGTWIAESEFDEFVEVLCMRHGNEREALLRQAVSRRRSIPRGEEPSGFSIAGTYACYSHAWSPYFAGRLIRGEVSISALASSQKLSAIWVERLPTGRVELHGSVVPAPSGLFLDLRDGPGDTRIFVCLFPAKQPASVLGGLMSGTTFIGPDAQPSVTRIIMVRLPAPSMRLRSAEAYLQPGASVAADLASLGVRVPDRDAADERVEAFLAGGAGGGLDQIAAVAYRTLVDVFDPLWIARASSAA